MPTLPTVDVTQAQADRLLAAHGSAANYRRWLVEANKKFVIDYERAAINTKYEVLRQAEIDAVGQAMDVPLT